MERIQDYVKNTLITPTRWLALDPIRQTLHTARPGWSFAQRILVVGGPMISSGINPER